jgi:hypothetical protein
MDRECCADLMSELDGLFSISEPWLSLVLRNPLYLRPD